MKKVNSLLVSVLGIFAISLASAAYYPGTFSLGDFLNQTDSSTLILGSIFIISFAFLNFALGKYFKDNKAISGSVSFAVSLLIIYAINRSGLNFDTFFFNIGISSDVLLPAMYLIFFAAFIFLVIKFGLAKTFIAFGALLVLVSFIPGLIYETGTAFFFGIILIIIGIAIFLFFKKKPNLSGAGRGALKGGKWAGGKAADLGKKLINRNQPQNQNPSGAWTGQLRP